MGSSKRMKTEVEINKSSEEKSSRNQTNLASKDTKLEPINSEYLEPTQDEKFINISSENNSCACESETHTNYIFSSFHSETSTNNGPSTSDSETESRVEQPYDPFRPLSPCGSVSPYDPDRPTESPYDPASPTESPYDPASPTESVTSDSSVELLEPKCLSRRLKKLARKGSFDALAPQIILCPDISPLENTFGEIDTYASFLEASSMSPPQDDPSETIKTEVELNLEETTKKEEDSQSCKSESKRRSKANASGENKTLNKILEEAKTALNPALEGGQISKSVYPKILTTACGTIKTEGGMSLEVNVTCETKNEVEEIESLSYKSKSKIRSKANASGENERLDKILEEAKIALKPALQGGQISKSDYAKILSKALPKIYYNKHKKINKPKIRKLMQEYVKKYQH